MSKIERMTIAVPAEMASIVRDAVSCGDYASSSEVFRDAMRQWIRRRVIDAQDMEAARQALQQGLADIDAGRLRPADAVLSRLESKYGGG